MTIAELTKLIGEWNLEVFADNPDTGIVLHLQEEVGELREAVQFLTAHDQGDEIGPNLFEVRDELDDGIADVLILTLSLAFRRGIDVQEAVLAKHEINKKRTWVRDDEAGYHRHVEEASAR